MRHPKSHQGPPILSCFRNFAPQMPPGPSDALPPPRCCTPLSSGPLHYLRPPEMLAPRILWEPLSPLPEELHLLWAPLPHRIPPKPAPRGPTPTPVLPLRSGPQTLPVRRGPAAVRPHIPQPRHWVTARHSGRGPSSRTLLPAPYLTARGSDESTAASPPARRLLRTRRRAPLGGR